MKRLKIILILVGVILIGCVAVVCFGPKEPTYKGRTLTEWLDHRYALARFSPGPGTAEGEYEEALRAIGTNAFPKLLSMMGSSDGALRRNVINLINRQRIVRIHIRTSDEKIFNAFVAFSTLGSNAAPAVPELLKLTKHSNPAVRRYSLHSIYMILRDNDVVRKAVLEAVGDPDKSLSEWAGVLLRVAFPEEAARLGIDSRGMDATRRATNSAAVRK